MDWTHAFAILSDDISGELVTSILGLAIPFAMAAAATIGFVWSYLTRKIPLHHLALGLLTACVILLVFGSPAVITLVRPAVVVTGRLATIEDGDHASRYAVIDVKEAFELGEGGLGDPVSLPSRASLRITNSLDERLTGSELINRRISLACTPQRTCAVLAVDGSLEHHPW